MLHCVTSEVAKKILEELNEGVCSFHIGGRALAFMVIRTCYYWPSLREDAMNLVRTCDKCQKFTPIQWPTTPLTLIISPLPFATWGKDIPRRFPKATGQHRYLFVTVDYFTKRIEAEAVASITAVEVQKFI